MIGAFQAEAVGYLLRAELHLQPGPAKSAVNHASAAYSTCVIGAGHRIGPPACAACVTSLESLFRLPPDLTVDDIGRQISV